ncbi:hypothetical protein Btru_026477 [Bulinus truncatus]|nr:hypothetical protein Btru_026477 [Bulinus truncatus]
MQGILLILLVGPLFAEPAADLPTEKIYFAEDRQINFLCPEMGLASAKFSVNLTGPYEVVLVDVCVKANCSDLKNLKAKFNYENGDYNITYTPQTMKHLRQLTRILCIYDEDIYKDFDVVIFSRPENSCEAPILTDTTVKIKCMSHKVFPSVVWRFIFRDNETEVHGEVSYDEEEIEVDHLAYLVVNITFESPLVLFDEGVYEFSAVVIPGGYNVTQHHQHITVPSTLTMILPRVALEKGCHSQRNKDGTTVYGSAVDCMCYLENTGKPPGQLAWVDVKGKETGIRLNNYAVVLNLTQANNREVFFCEVSSVLGNFSATIPFSIIYQTPIIIEIEIDGYLPLILFILFLLLIYGCLHGSSSKIFVMIQDIHQDFIQCCWVNYPK